jgi:4-hydroxy-tetrahydrodipicolinate synthase
MIIAPGIFPEDYQQVVRQVEAGRWHEALRLFAARILPFIQVFGPGDEVSTTKALLHHLGIFRSAEVRPPLITSSAERAQQVIVAYEVCEAGAAMPAPAATVS